METTRVHDHDDTVETHYSGLERLGCAAYYRGLAYIGHLGLTEEGEEVEVITAVPCRRCERERARRQRTIRAWASFSRCLGLLVSPAGGQKTYVV